MSPQEPYLGRIARFVRLHDRHGVRVFVTCSDCGLALHEIERVVIEHEEGNDRC